MELLTIEEALIVNGVVIANGIADSDGDILTKKDIKTIFMKYERATDTMHTNIKNEGVDVFGSWISEVDTTIGGKPVPAGSWLATIKVTNQKLIQCITEGRLKGFSLGSVSDKAFTPEYWFINKSLNYRDIKDIEEVIPLFISFVDRPANQYDFEVMTYDAYINKNEKDVTEMTEEKTEMITAPVSFFDKVFDALGIQKSEEDVTVEKADEEVVETTTEETSADDKVTLLFEKLDTIIEQNNQILEGLNKSEEEEEEVDEEEEIEKAEEDEEEEEASEDEEKDEEIEKEETSEGDAETETESEEEDEDDVHVEKRETNMIEKQVTESNKTFYQNTGRDHLGRKIRK